MTANPLIQLRRASSSRSSGTWADDDYDVIEGERVIGRIYRYDSRAKETWFWGIDSLLIAGRSIYGDVIGTREDAMAAFKSAWMVAPKRYGKLAPPGDG